MYDGAARPSDPFTPLARVFVSLRSLRLVGKSSCFAQRTRRVNSGSNTLAEGKTEIAWAGVTGRDTDRPDETRKIDAGPMVAAVSEGSGKRVRSGAGRVGEAP